MVQGGLPQERRRDGQLLGLSDEQRQRAEQRSDQPRSGQQRELLHDGYTIGSPYYTTEVGEFENSESPYGTFDQGGNIWEWNETVIRFVAWFAGRRLERLFRSACWPPTATSYDPTNENRHSVSAWQVFLSPQHLCCSHSTTTLHGTTVMGRPMRPTTRDRHG